MAKPRTPKAEAAPQTEPAEDQRDTGDVSATLTDAEPVEMAEPVSVAPEVSAPPVAPQVPAARRGGGVPMFLGGVAAAAIGAGAVMYLLPQLPPAWLPVAEAPQYDDSALRAVLAEQTVRADALTNELAALKAVPAPDLAPLAAAVTEARELADAAMSQLDALEPRLTALEKRPVAGGGASATALEAFEREMVEMRALIAQSRDTASASQAEIAAAAETAAQQIAAAEADAARLRAEAEAAASRSIAQAAVARLGAALDSGNPTAAALADLGAAGVAIPAELTAEIPTLASLRASFPEAARAALGVSRRVTAGEGTMDKVGAFLMAQTGARSLQPQDGTDPDAVLSRAEAALGAGDIDTVLAEIGALPEEGRAALTDWAAQAQQRLAATNALAVLAQSLN